MKRGAKHSPATLLKISAAKRGQKQSKQSNQKRSASLRVHYDRVGRQTPEERRAKEAAYWHINKEKKKTKDARYVAKHKARLNAQNLEYRKAHRRQAVERVKRWRELNRGRCNTIGANRRARLAGAEGLHTNGEWELLKLQYGHACAKCGRREPEIKLTRDHIIPLARGGSNWIGNIQPLCGKCNCEKHAKMPDEVIAPNQ